MIAWLFSVQAQLSVSINVNVNQKFLTWLEEQNDYEVHEVNCGWRCAVCFSSVGSRISCRKMAEESAEALSHVSDATTTTEEATITDVQCNYCHAIVFVVWYRIVFRLGCCNHRSHWNSSQRTHTLRVGGFKTTQ